MKSGKNKPAKPIDKKSQQPRYIGRFAPSPSGPLHLGSLFTALASFLDARAHRGQWLLRIDDLDTFRNVPGATDSIIQTLDTLGLHWDQSIYYQSQHVELYQALLDKLQKQGWLYPCTCNRKDLARKNAYPGYCLNKTVETGLPHALRVKTQNRDITFYDRLQGLFQQNLSQSPGDFIVRRKDNITAYQFAVVIDEYQQHITHVVRGFDLLDSTPRQIYLQNLLDYPQPEYMHLPVIVDRQGDKLSKQTGAQAVSTKNPSKTLYFLLSLLKQQPPAELVDAPPSEILDWAIIHWQAEHLKKTRAIFSEID